MSPEEEEEFIERKTAKVYKKLKWSKGEKIFRIRPKFRYPCLIRNQIPVSLALRTKLRNSCFGRFMKTFNEDQNQNLYLNQNKIGIEDWDIKHHNAKDASDWKYNHNFCDDVFNFLNTAVETEDCIDYDYIYNNLKGLRLTDCQINYVNSLKRFAKLEILILAGNWIKTIRGKKLPSKLEFLECFVNEISNITKLCEECPTRIKHIGLGRNRLTNDSCFHLLASSGSFTELQTLDLSNNNIENLQYLLDQLKGLPRLIGLMLEGNPCYGCEAYKENILHIFPRLLYLDETEILEEDRNIENCDLELGVNSSGLIFTCYRLIGLPSPPKGNVVHTYHLEVELPLLEEIALPVVEKPVVIEEPPKEEKPAETKKGKGKGKDKGKGTDKGKDKKKDKKSTKSSTKKAKVPKPVKGKGLYALPDEYESEMKGIIKNKNFKTEPREWKQVIKYNNPALTADTPRNNLLLLRDTFRSRVKVKIVYTQKFVEKKKKKKKKDKSSEADPQMPEEIILKKSTFATFYCDLHSVNWSDQYVDFIWADFPRLTDRAIAVEGSLKPEIYKEGKGKGKGKGKDKSKDKKSKSSSKGKSSKGKSAKGAEKLPLPTKLTCHIGFGMKRHGQIQEIEAVRKSKKPKK